MSLINDALRRASQTEKESAPRPAAPLAMEPVVHRGGSKVSLVLSTLVVVVLGLAGWFFWQWWNVRSKSHGAVVVVRAAAPAPVKVAQAPVVVVPKPAPAPAPVAIVKAAPVAQASSPAPAPVSVPVVARLPAVVTPVGSPAPVDDNQIAWPVKLKISAIFYNETNPRTLIDGDIYHVGDTVHGTIVIKKIDKETVTGEWNGHTKVFRMDNE